MVGNKVARMISGRRTDYGVTATENRTALEFFLDRATRARLQLDGHRLQDVRMRSYRAVPLVVAAAAGDAFAIALLLRHGVADQSARAAIAYLRDAAADTRGRPLASGVQSCLDVLLRAVVSENDCDGPNDVSGVGRAPPPLLHLARCSVRKTLYENFGLPHGIPQLPVPRSLLPYLHLEC